MAAGKGSGKSTRSWLSSILVAVIFLGLAFVIAIISIATPHFIDTVVKRPNTLADATRSLAYSRYQGLFMTCYTGGDISQLPYETDGRNSYRVERFYATSDQCVVEEAYTVFSQEGIKYNREYVTRANVLRATVALLGVGLLLIALAFFLMFCAMCGTARGTLIAAGVIALFGAISMLIGMGMFTWVYFIQYNQIGLNYEEYWNGWRQSSLYQSYVSRSTVSLGYSYVLGWIAAGLALLGALLALFASCCANPENANGSVKAAPAEATKTAVNTVTTKTTQEQVVEPVYSVQTMPQEVVQRPVIQAASPRVDVIRVPYTVQQQPATVQQPTYTFQQPTTTVQQPGFTLQQPATVQQPTYIIQPPIQADTSPPAYYNTAAVRQGLTGNNQVPNFSGVTLATAAPFYQGTGEKVVTNGATTGTARIWSDASAYTAKRAADQAQTEYQGKTLVFP